MTYCTVHFHEAKVLLKRGLFPSGWDARPSHSCCVKGIPNGSVVHIHICVHPWVERDDVDLTTFYTEQKMQWQR